MTVDPKPHRAHLYLIEALIGILLLGVAGFLLVRNMNAAKERAQREQITETLENWCEYLSSPERQSQDTPTIFALLKANSKLHDARNSLGFTPLHVGAIEGNREITQWLLDHGAEINAKDNNGETPLHWAANYGRIEVAELLLAKGADINAKTDGGWTPLNEATWLGRKELAELLLTKGADINTQDIYGKSPLDYAKQLGNQPLIDLLRAHGAKE